MKKQICGIVGIVMAAMVVGCAQPPPQQCCAASPNGTMFSGASGAQASSLAQLVKAQRSPEKSN